MNLHRCYSTHPMAKSSTQSTTPQSSNARLSDLKRGDRLSETQYYEVLGVVPGLRPSIDVVNERGMRMNITGKIVEEGMYSASQFTTEVQVTKTELAELLGTAGDAILTVHFCKQLKEKDVVSEILTAATSLFGSKPIATALKDLGRTVRSSVKKGLKGEGRTLVGYRIGSEPLLGRTHMIDVEIENDTSKSYDPRMRLVDHRTLEWIILRGVKYIVKKR